jgi:protein-disulfide isomerase
MVRGLFLCLMLISLHTFIWSDQEDIKKKLALGNPNSSIEIYVFSDWFCSSCKKAEPDIEKAYPKLKSKAAFYFIDYALNPKSNNFSPYNIAFLINEKEKYFKARQALIDLAEKNESPKDKDVKKAVKKYKLELHEVSFPEVREATKFFDAMVHKYRVNATPTVVIVNTESHQMETLTGSRITDKKLLEAVKSLEENK